MIRVTLPFHLRNLAGLEPDQHEITLDVESPASELVTLRAVLDALEARYPMLRGTVRDHVTHERRAFLRFFVCGEDWSHESPDTPLPKRIATGEEAFMIIGAIAGG